MPQYDRCRYDLTKCGRVMPNTTCEVPCMLPYVSESLGVASCPAGNVDPKTELRLTVPFCDMDCTPLEDVPTGYVSYPYIKTDIGWTCASGYSGFVTTGCGTAPDCSLKLELTGCENVVRCAPPTLKQEELCVLNTLECFLVSSGGACDISCRPPFVGDIAVATCPENNVIPFRALEWERPTCMVYHCPDPVGGVPPGYRRILGEEGVQPDTWECDDNFYGRAEWSCELDNLCNARTVLKGCLPLSPCVMPANAEFCIVDFSDCYSGVFPEKFCEIKCNAPYFGNSTFGTCAFENTDPTREMIWSLPSCSIACEDPLNETEEAEGMESWPGQPLLFLPEGYNKTQYECDVGYASATGGARTRCTTDDSCTAFVEFTGCDPLQPCGEPQVSELERCLLDTSSCSSVDPGSSCEVSCRPGLIDVSGPTRAFCPEGNVNTSNEILWIKPRCDLSCEEPNPWPVGYERLRSGCWVCAPTHFGIAQEKCVIYPEANCTQKLLLSGCLPRVPCAPPALDDNVSSCRNNISLVMRLLPGETGQITCKWPYRPLNGTGIATCPAANTDPFAEPTWIPPNCSLTCTDPKPIPVGYNKTKDGNWTCSTGYAGNVVASCGPDEDCQPQLTLTGCLPIVDCLIPDVDLCMLDISDCGAGVSIKPGAECKITCKAPYTERPGFPEGTMECLTTNTDYARGIKYFAPSCKLGCAAIGYGVQGYTSDNYGWKCASGYFGGPVSFACEARQQFGNVPYSASCVSRPVLSGCHELLPCAPLILDGADACMFETSECSGVPSTLTANTMCRTYCRRPHYGKHTVAVCEPLNGDPMTQLVWPPRMRPQCRCPNPNPQAGGLVPYELTQTEKDRELLESLLVKFAGPEYESNMDIQGLSARIRMIYHELDRSRTMADFATRDVVAWDVLQKNISSMLLQIEETWLTQFLHEVINPPFGFTWKCTDDHSGSVQERCVVTPRTCEAYLELSGCESIKPCALPTLTVQTDRCMYDFTACGDQLPPGGSCQASCRAPYEDMNMSMVTCPVGNTIFGAPATAWLECGLTCPQPDPLPVGYRTGQWRCADGYGGRASVTCGYDNMTEEGRNCSSTVRLSGCSPLVPCVPPMIEGIEDCTYDVSECQQVWPGQFCNIYCKKNTVGEPAKALCPPDNTDPMRELIWVKPVCTPQCAFPVPEKKDEYVWTRNCGWQCGPEYIGSPVTHCEFSRLSYESVKMCKTETWLTGCQLRQPCIEPRYDKCKYDFSSCQTGVIRHGYNCSFGCKAPWVGGTSHASCPIDNVVRFAPLKWSEPEPACYFKCPEVPDPPAGYKQGVDYMKIFGARSLTRCFGLGDGNVGSIWHAHSRQLLVAFAQPAGYVNFSVNGPPQQLHANYSLFSSSNRKSMPFAVSSLVWMNETGRYVVAPQSQTLAPHAAELRMGSVAANGSLLAADPIDFSDNFTGRCLWQSSSSSDFLCFDGEAVRIWNTSATGQNVTFVRSVKLQGLKVDPNATNSSGGRFAYDGRFFFILRGNAGACLTEYGVYSSTTGTREGFFKLDEEAGACAHGLYFDWSASRYSTHAGGGGKQQHRCRDCTIVGGREHEQDDLECWTEPKVTDDWRCDFGYIGEVDVKCEPDAQCTNRLTFNGCTKLEPCVPPAIPDKCVIDATSCDSVGPGKSCELKCRAPVYVGSTTVGSCPEGNVDAKQPLLLEDGLPSCILECPMPVFDDPAYTHNESGHWSDWRCSDNAIGQASVSCDLNKETCDARMKLEGCKMLQSCVVPEKNRCRIDASACDPLPSGGSCVASCKPAFTEINATGICPTGNTIENMEVQWYPDLNCECLEPDEIPKGYAKKNETELAANASAIEKAEGDAKVSLHWKCDRNYTGTPRLDCLCDGRLVFSGCLPVVRCAPLDPAYLTNQSQCQEVPSGYTCTAECARAGCIAGGPLELVCPEENTDSARQPDIVSGKCEVVCEVCTTSLLTDSDPREGILTGTLVFGPAAARGEVMLPEIIGFKGVFSDVCDKNLGEAFPLVPVVDYDPGCCRGDIYSAFLNATTIPESATHISVLVQTIHGELPHGRRVSFIDSVGTITRVQDSGAPSRQLLALLSLSLSLAAAAAAAALRA
eukprot:TRINITY_DN5296_c0_g1_i2.p1 TRINITY_DN5296_c0_g1~~TRINITY_DN5296_c0_g1_i2.p1  ORF type:complete len:2437 (+),score=447.74 TRINITY_DN5296_c0_g1_i2:1023-7313(+)